jgi:hypothetical protein
MVRAISVRCPSCFRDHMYTSPVYPCACGEPLSPPLLPSAEPERIVRRTWDGDWVAVRCLSCEREGHWPQPELGCPCGTLLRIPVSPVGTEGGTGPAAATGGPGIRPDTATAPGFAPPRHGEPEAPPPPHPAWPPQPPQPAPDAHGAPPPRSGYRPPAPPPPPHPAASPPTGNRPKDAAPPAGPPARPDFLPRIIQTSRDAVTTAERYLRWLGLPPVEQWETHRPEPGPRAGLAPAVDLRGQGLLAQVEPSTRPANQRDVECLWLKGMNESASTLFFSVAGYTAGALEGAERLGIPLFVLDLRGTPRAVNRVADELVSGSAG